MPDFSPFAREYASSRPGYPPELFADLAALARRRELAWDCATGNGQAAVGLAEHFERVIATDISDAQIRNGIAHPRVEYRVVSSESSGLADHSVDLITVASAIHWFDIEAFLAEARRVARAGAVLAAWSYHIGHVEAPFDAVFARFYHDVLFSYFDPKARIVDDRYESLVLPGEPLETGEYRMTVRWNLDQMLAFIASWSGTRAYIEKHGTDPVDAIADELAGVWGARDEIHTIRWPLYLRASRLDESERAHP